MVHDVEMDDDSDRVDETVRLAEVDADMVAETLGEKEDSEGEPIETDWLIDVVELVV